MILGIIPEVKQPNADEPINERQIKNNKLSNTGLGRASFYRRVTVFQHPVIHTLAVQVDVCQQSTIFLGRNIAQCDCFAQNLCAQCVAGYNGRVFFGLSGVDAE